MYTWRTQNCFSSHSTYLRSPALRASSKVWGPSFCYFGFSVSASSFWSYINTRTTASPASPRFSTVNAWFKRTWNTVLPTDCAAVPDIILFAFLNVDFSCACNESLSLFPKTRFAIVVESNWKHIYMHNPLMQNLHIFFSVFELIPPPSNTPK